jgi:hypothetical protein
MWCSVQLLQKINSTHYIHTGSLTGPHSEGFIEVLKNRPGPLGYKKKLVSNHRQQIIFAIFY